MLAVLIAAGAAGAGGASLRAELGAPPAEPQPRLRPPEKWTGLLDRIVGQTRKFNRDTQERARHAAELAVDVARNLTVVAVPPPEAARGTTDAEVVCKAADTEACGFQTEVGTPLDCGSGQSAREVYAKWVPPNAAVLEVGAQYGQATCMLAQRVRKLVSVEPDRLVIPALEQNLKSHNCTNVRLVKGVVGPRDLYFTRAWDGGSSVTSEAPQTWIDPGTGLPAPSGSPVTTTQRVRATHYEVLGFAADTLLIDCNGCFAKFLDDNPNIVGTLRLVIVRVDEAWPGEQGEVDQLLREGWNLVDTYHHHKVLCRDDQRCEVVDKNCALPREAEPPFHAPTSMTPPA